MGVKNMQTYSLKLLSAKKLLAIAAILGLGVVIASYNALSSTQNNPWKYRFQRPEVGIVTKNIQKEIAFYQQRIQQQPNAGLERASLASAYLRMAKATGDSSWYLLAQQTAEQSLA
jgi:hypothetical protein